MRTCVGQPSTSPLRRIRPVASLAALCAGVLLTGACSGGGESAEASGASTRRGLSYDQNTAVAAFCQGAQALYQQFLSAGSVTDPANPVVQDVFTTARGLVPPQEIANDWTLILDSLEPIVTGQISVDDPVAMERVGQEAAANAAAYERVGTYISQACGLGATSTTAVIVP